MSSTSTSPDIIVAGGNWGNETWTTGSSPLQVAFQNLVSGAADAVTATGTKVFILDSNEISSAWSYMSNVYETQDQVAQNYSILKQIADYCRANGITIQVNAVLTNPATYSDGTNALVSQWAGVAAAVGLPISRIQDVNEAATNNPSASSPSDFASTATVEVNAIRTLLQSYETSSYHLTASNLQVGDMEGGTPTSAAAWWAAYNQVAAANALPGFTFWTTDLNQYGPWLDPLATPAWQSTLESMSAAAKAAGMSTNLLVQGAAVDQTGEQFVAQAEQNAADVAKLIAQGKVSIDSIELQSWASLPVGVGLITSPASIANEAVEIAATFSLYATGSITGTGGALISAPGQLIVTTNTAQSVGGLAVNWSAKNPDAGGRYAIVLVDQTGTLTATAYGSGTVKNNGSNVLILNGTSADLAAELASVMVTEASAGPDTLDVEVFGTQGRLADAQVYLMAAASGQSVDAIAAGSSRQGWSSASATLNTGIVAAAGSVMTSETLYWNTAAQTASGQPAFLNTIAIHQPLAEYGVKNTSSIVLGTTYDAVVDIFDSATDWAPYTVNGYANNAGQNNATSPQTTGWLPAAFNAAAAVTPMVVQSTINTFDSATGKLLSSVRNLAPSPSTVVDLAGKYSNPYATNFNNGGTQIVEYNTGNNPGWNAGWSDQFNTATLTYDDSGHLVELFLQGGPTCPQFTFDYVFNPNTGALWELFETAAPPPASANGQTYLGTSNPYEAGFVSGPLFITQFRTGNDPNTPVDNPNWDYLDWGADVSVDTELWTDYFMMANFSGFALNYARTSLNNYPYQFINGTTLDLMYLPGTINVDLNSLGVVTIASLTEWFDLTGLNAIDAAGATGTVTITGRQAGASVLIGGDVTSTIKGYGHDTIIAGSGRTSIDTGAGNSVVRISRPMSTVSIAGNGNTITAAGGGALTLSGTGDILNGSSLTVTVATAGAMLTEAGQSGTVYFLNSGTLIETGAASSAAARGSAITAKIDNDGGTLSATGNNNVVIGRQRATLVVGGNNNSVQAGLGSDVTVSGANDHVTATGATVHVGPGTAGLLVGGDGNVVLAPTGGSLTIQGANNAIVASGATILTAGSAAISITGSNDTVRGCAGGSITIGEGSGNVIIGSGSTITASGACSGDTFTLSGQDTLILTRPTTFGGVIDGKPGDKIVLQGVTPTSAVYSGGKLVIKSGNSTIMSVSVSGSMASDVYTVDGSVIRIGSPGASSPAAGQFSVSSAASGSNLIVSGTPYNGPVAGLTSQFVIPTSEQLMVHAQTPNVFIQIGAQGQNNPLIAGIDVSSANGNNILDSYANSSFLVNGSGIDQDYIDARAATQNSWSTIVNFHSGSNVTVWGVTPQDFVLQWIGDNYGASGATGLTGVYTSSSKPVIGITLAGYTNADLVNGRLTISYNSIEGNPYASIHAN